MFKDLTTYAAQYLFWLIIFAIAVFLYIDDKKKHEQKLQKEQNFIDNLHSICLGDSFGEILQSLGKPTSSSILKDGTEKYEWVWKNTTPQKRTIIWAKDGFVTSVSHINV